MPEEKIQIPKPRNLKELADNPFPVFPHELFTTGPQVNCCKFCGLAADGIQKFSLACTPEREKLRVGEW